MVTAQHCGYSDILYQIFAGLRQPDEESQGAVLEGNEIDREILISLELLVSWDLVTPTFPQETVTNYFIRKNKEKNKHQFFQSAHTAKNSKEKVFSTNLGPHQIVVLC